MLYHLNTIQNILTPTLQRVETWLSPAVLLGIRLLVAKSFLVSGWLKFGYIWHGQTDTLYFLFEDYNVPFLSTELAAWMGTFGELGFGLLVALGLFGRLGALGLIGMAGMIYIVDQNHLSPYWALMMGVIVAYGPGLISLDALFGKALKTQAAFLDKPALT